MHLFIRKIIHIPDEFYNKLVEFIQEKYGSLRKFSNALGYSVSYVSAILNDKKNLTIDLIMKLDELGFEYDLKEILK